MKLKKISSLAVLLIASVAAAHAQLKITEVDPAGSSASYAADWFEVWNSGPTAVDVTGWKMDDNSSNYLSAAVSIRGITSIAAGQFVIFLEGNATGTTDSTIDANFSTAWFGANPPAGLTLANYGGSGVGLSTTTDAVNLFDTSGVAQAYVTFNAAPAGATFDNAAGLNGLISQASVAGVNGAFSDGAEIGSPGTITAAPEPSSLVLAGFGGLAALVGFSRFKNRQA
jgi:hypothetical protein